MMYIRTLLVVAIIWSQSFIRAQDSSAEQTSSPAHEIIINKDSFGTYPAVVLNLDTHELIKFDKGKTEEETFKGIKVKNGFFIEPDDPEFASISINDSGLRPQLLTLEDSLSVTLEDAKKLEINREKLDADEIKSGLFFIVKTTEGAFYRFQILLFDKVANELKLRYKKIE
ncbi:hypothetical protein GCM10022393_16570 [Aquimarina addita]|uniref:DUF4138 domain-containing protein n=1 Tax=Aquimarina addita TaxID=870485 RepID=A0ABP7XH84_9FLAO